MLHTSLSIFLDIISNVLRVIFLAFYNANVHTMVMHLSMDDKNFLTLFYLGYFVFFHADRVYLWLQYNRQLLSGSFALGVDNP